MEIVSLSFFEEIWTQISLLYFLPGDSLIACFTGTFIGEFYEFQPSDRGGIFSFFVPWFLLSILMVSIDDTSPKGVTLFKKERKKILTKKGKEKSVNALIILLILVFVYTALSLFGIEYIWLNFLLLAVFVFLSWYTIFTNGYSTQRKRFKKSEKILTKHGKKLSLKLLVIISTLFTLYFISYFFNHSCFIILFFILVFIIMFYLSVGSRWDRLKSKISGLYKKARAYLK
jgi:L-asparagine transporter-like permease